MRLLLDLKVKNHRFSWLCTCFQCFYLDFFKPSYANCIKYNDGWSGNLSFSVKYKPSRFMILTICYFAYLIVITFIYHNKAADIHLIISNLKIVFMLCAIEYLLKRTPHSTINIMFFILITLL